MTRQSSKMNFDSGKGASFFKILLRESIDYLPLPPAFAKKYLENGNNKRQTLVLKTKSGQKWSVQYLNIENRYYFKNGWLKFMIDNHLQMGDFLVFWLLSDPSPNPTFQVFLYAPNGCLKNQTTLHSAGPSQGKKPFIKEKTSNYDLLQKFNNSFKKVVTKSYIDRMEMKNSFARATGINDSVQLRNNKGKIWNVKVKRYGRQQKPRMITGWVDFRKENKIDIGDTCEFYHVKSDLLHVRVIKKMGRYLN